MICCHVFSFQSSVALWPVPVLSIACRVDWRALADGYIVQPEQTIVNYSNVTVILQTLQKYEQTINSIIDIMIRACACACVRVCACACVRVACETSGRDNP